MKLVLAAALLLASAGANAQIAVDSTSTTTTQTSAASDASNRGNSLTNNFEAGDRMHYDYGHQRIEQVAPLSLGGAAAGFSNENCANTTQAGLGTFWFSAAKGSATESIRCNARRDAGVYVALAADADANNNHVIAAKLRSMAIFQKCTATEQELAACKSLGLVADGGTAGVNTDSYRAAHAGDPMGITDEPQVDPRKVPADRGSADVRLNP